MEFWPGPQKINLKCGNKSRQIMHCLYGFWPEPQKMNLSVGILYWNSTVYVHHTQQNLHLIFSFSLGESMYVYVHSSCEPKIFGMGQYNNISLTFVTSQFYPFQSRPLSDYMYQAQCLFFFPHHLQNSCSWCCQEPFEIQLESPHCLWILSI